MDLEMTQENYPLWTEFVCFRQSGYNHNHFHSQWFTVPYFLALNFVVYFMPTFPIPEYIWSFKLIEKCKVEREFGRFIIWSELRNSFLTLFLFLNKSRSSFCTRWFCKWRFMDVVIINIPLYPSRLSWGEVEQQLYIAWKWIFNRLGLWKKRSSFSYSSNMSSLKRDCNWVMLCYVISTVNKLHRKKSAIIFFFCTKI